LTVLSALNVPEYKIGTYHTNVRPDWLFWFRGSVFLQVDTAASKEIYASVLELWFPPARLQHVTTKMTTIQTLKKQKYFLMKLQQKSILKMSVFAASKLRIIRTRSTKYFSYMMPCFLVQIHQIFAKTCFFSFHTP
jgi:hypothetical protein